MAGKPDAKYVDRGGMLALRPNMGRARRELAGANRKKPGRPFRCPESIIFRLAMARSLFGVGHRELEGLLAESLGGEFRIGFVQIWRRVSAIDVGFSERDGVFTFRNSLTGAVDEIKVAFDGTGSRAGRSGAWKLEKWGVRLGFVRITLAVNAEDKKIIAMTVTDDATSELSQFPKLLRAVVEARNRHMRSRAGGSADGGNADGGNADGGNADGGNADGGNADGGNADGGNADGGNADGGNADGRRAPRRRGGEGIVALGDGIYATRANVNLCERHGVRPVMKVHINSSGRSIGSGARRQLVIAQLGGGSPHIAGIGREERKRNRREWLRDNGYGRRSSVETAFSTIKVVFRDYVMARNWDQVVRELAFMAYAYNLLIDKALEGG